MLLSSSTTTIHAVAIGAGHLLRLTMAAIPPPAVANASSNASMVAAYQGGHANADIRIGRSSKRLKVAETLHATGGTITEQELG